MSSPGAGKHRRDIDLKKLQESKYEVTFTDLNDFIVKFRGPPDTPYEGGIWRVRVHLPDDYPFKSPSIGFVNKIFHPNVDEISGSVCIDVINHTWTPLYDLANIFDYFLPQLLGYPNASDPLNNEAALMMQTKPQDYHKTVKEYIRKYATESETVEGQEGNDTTDGNFSPESGTSVSDFSEDEEQELAIDEQPG